MSLTAYAGLLCIAASASILLRQLVKKPIIDRANKLLLALGFGLFPVLAVALTTANGLHETTTRSFCGECHVMTPHVSDANNPESNSLAARHARNSFFGDRNCYVCHADYSMLGYPLTKINGMKHVWHYYTGGYLELTPAEALKRIKLYKPYDNNNCRQCHSGELSIWSDVPEHQALAGSLGKNEVSCASGGCHGFAHPFSKPTVAKVAEGGDHVR